MYQTLSSLLKYRRKWVAIRNYFPVRLEVTFFPNLFTESLQSCPDQLSFSSAGEVNVWLCHRQQSRSSSSSLSPFQMTHMLLPKMVDKWVFTLSLSLYHHPPTHSLTHRGRGIVINISSALQDVPAQMTCSYSATKVCLYQKLPISRWLVASLIRLSTFFTVFHK